MGIRRMLSAVVFVTVITVPGVAHAGNPHFIKSATDATLQGADLVVTFKEAGLPSGSVEFITARADATTTYECVNGGGRNPAASNKKTTRSEVSKTEPFTADRNGNVVGSETLSPPTAEDLGFGCPNGQTVTFVSVEYSHVSVVDETSGASLSLPGTFSFTNPDAPPVR